MAARRAHDPEVAGSSPASATNIPCVQRGRVGLRHKLGTSDYPHLSMMCPSDIKSEYMHPWLNGRAAAL